MQTKPSSWLWLIVLQIAVLMLLQFFNLAKAVPRPNGADASGYYAWGQSWLDDKDSDPTNQLAGNPLFPQVEGKSGPSSKVVLDKYPIGWSVAVFPAMAVAKAMNNGPVDSEEGSLAPLVVRSAWIAVYVWCIAGLLAAYDSIRLLSEPRSSACAVVLAWLGTSAFAYTWKSPGMAHGVGMSAICLAYWCAVRRRHSGWSIWLSLLWGIFASLAVVTRIFNVLILVPSALMLVCDQKIALKELTSRKALVRMVTALLGMAPLLLLQAWIWHSVYGVWYFNGYASNHERFAFNGINLMLFLVSTQKGVLLWHPIIIMAIAGLWVAYRGHGTDLPHRGLTLWCIGTVLIVTLLYASWSDWTLGDGYGARWTADLFWIWAFGLACLFSGVQAHLRRVLVLAICCAVISVAWMGGQITNRVPLNDRLTVQLPRLGRLQLP